jgi:FtsP/CotA-like multicopper oxidase with cupredoxin domain
MIPPLTRRRMLALAGGIPLLVRAEGPADITLRIGEIKADLGFGRSVKTLAYNGQIPGPVLRMTEGRRTRVEVINEATLPEMVHWHGFHIPPDVDGAHEEGTPMVQGHDRRTYEFTASPAGTRWYHTHAMAGHNLNIGTYSGQFGMCVVEPAHNPARYDVEIPLLLHEFEPYFAATADMDLSYRVFTVNGKMLGTGEPVRVRAGQRALFRVVNASATLEHKVALAGHTFMVVALDGNPVARPQSVPVLRLAPGERADAVVEMKNPGVWVFGEIDAAQRGAGAGIVVEYAGTGGKPRWISPAALEWDYAAFGEAVEAPKPDVRIPVVIEPGKDGNLWAINGKSYPNTDDILLHKGLRNRLSFDNRGAMDHPVHLHRHTFELTRVGGKSMSGVFKDVVLVPARGTVEVDIVADNPGPSLFHCHQQFHMDFGFMALTRYAG